MASRPARNAAEDCEIGDEPPPAQLRAGTAVRPVDDRGRAADRWTARDVHRPQPVAAARSSVGSGMEPRTDRSQTAPGPPRYSRDADLALGDLPGPLHRRPRRTETRAR